MTLNKIKTQLLFAVVLSTFASTYTSIRDKEKIRRDCLKRAAFRYNRILKVTPLYRSAERLLADMQFLRVQVKPDKYRKYLPVYVSLRFKEHKRHADYPVATEAEFILNMMFRLHTEGHQRESAALASLPR